MKYDKELAGKVESAVRQIVFNGGRDGINASTTFEEMVLFATSGAGTNSTKITKDETVLYDARDYGKVVIAFRSGKWCDRIIKEADKLEAQARAAAAERARQAKEAEALRFAPIDY